MEQRKKNNFSLSAFIVIEVSSLERLETHEFKNCLEHLLLKMVPQKCPSALSSLLQVKQVAGATTIFVTTQSG